MIRQPTPHAQFYAWWKRALADPDLPRHDDDPQCGFYQMRRVKGGPWVPVRIFVVRDIEAETGDLEGPERLVAEINGEWTQPGSIWTHLRPISRADYAALLARIALNPALADPTKPINLMKEPARP